MVWKATQKIFGKWYLVNKGSRLMTLKTVIVKYKGKPEKVKEYRVRFFNTKANALKEARRLNMGGKKRAEDR